LALTGAAGTLLATTGIAVGATTSGVGSLSLSVVVVAGLVAGDCTQLKGNTDATADLLLLAELPM
jgi:hypothetical protein